MEKLYSQNQYIFLGRIAIGKQLISRMESDNSFHNFVYTCLMIHETGECERKSESQKIISTHKYKLVGVKFDIITDLSEEKTCIILSD